jgi:hypothetical protein
MAYGHAERNLDALRRLEQETAQFLQRLESLDDAERQWLVEYEARATHFLIKAGA